LSENPYLKILVYYLDINFVRVDSVSEHCAAAGECDRSGENRRCRRSRMKKLWPTDNGRQCMTPQRRTPNLLQRRERRMPSRRTAHGRQRKTSRRTLLQVNLSPDVCGRILVSDGTREGTSRTAAYPQNPRTGECATHVNHHHSHQITQHYFHQIMFLPSHPYLRLRVIESL
jgi:hypothetical protein